MPVALWIVIAAVIVLILCTSYITYRIAFYSPKANQNDIHKLPPGEQYEAQKDVMLALIDALAPVPFEPVSITSRDGLRLTGRYYHVAEGAPLDIGFHGYRGTAVRDYCGVSMISLKNGRNLLLVDQRAHSGSQGHTITFGVKERYDCLDWCRWAVNRFGEDVSIYLSGVSMGAATVLMASELDLPKNVRCIIADSPYTTPLAIIRKVCRDLHLPAWLLMPFTRLGAVLFGGFRPAAASAPEAVAHTSIPILLIHGEDDRFVPCQMSEVIRSACASPVEHQTFSGAGHGLSYLRDKPRYIAMVLDFWARCAGP
ncbi:MAG: alpha/beta hydrolase [Oscillospiraceae bacterium]|nr:alpha/beta hydrolase [Oscillospiraceae bacterium]